MNEKFEELHRKYGIRYLIVIFGMIALGLFLFFFGGYLR